MMFFLNLIAQSYLRFGFWFGKLLTSALRLPISFKCAQSEKSLRNTGLTNCYLNLGQILGERIKRKKQDLGERKVI